MRWQKVQICACVSLPSPTTMLVQMSVGVLTDARPLLLPLQNGRRNCVHTPKGSLLSIVGDVWKRMDQSPAAAAPLFSHEVHREGALLPLFFPLLAGKPGRGERNAAGRKSAFEDEERVGKFSQKT